MSQRDGAVHTRVIDKRTGTDVKRTFRSTDAAARWLSDQLDPISPKRKENTIRTILQTIRPTKKR